MHLHRASAEIFIPDGLPAPQALARTSHLAVAAHHDDLEIMAVEPIIQCFQQPERWFTGIVVSDGRGSPRADLYQNTSDEDMRAARIKEQKKASVVGEYAAQVFLDYSSEAIKDGKNQQPVDDLVELLGAARPQSVYTHNLADRHPTHVGVVLRVIAAIRRLPQADRPARLYGCEVWRDLDWMADGDKISFDLSQHENIQMALLGVFDSQIAGGKRYDLATMGRRRANATYSASHGVDTTSGLAYAMDLTPLIIDPTQDVATFIQSYIDRFSADVSRVLALVQ